MTLLFGRRKSERPGNVRDLDTTSAGDASQDITESAHDTESESVDMDHYPSPSRLTLITVFIVLTTFLVALDGTIIATALPTITSEFHSLEDLAWYTAAFFLTTCAFQLPYGRAYAVCDTKWVYISSIVIFEIGSAVCGAAPNPIALVFGRAIAGIGSAGIFAGVFIIIADCVPLKNRALFGGAVGAAFAIASVVGPILGEISALHNREHNLNHMRLSWRTIRWCLDKLGHLEMVLLQ